MDRPACRTTCLLRSQNRSARAGCDGLSRLDTSTRAQRRKPFGAASFEILENSHTVSRNRGSGRRVVTLASYAPADRFVIFARAGGCAPFFIAAPIGTLSTISDDFSICGSRYYKTVGEMPERDGDRMYRIKSPLEEHERVVGESLSALPSRFPQVAPRPERRSRNPKALLLLATLGGIAAQALVARELVPTGRAHRRARKLRARASAAAPLPVFHLNDKCPAADSKRHADGKTTVETVSFPIARSFLPESEDRENQGG